MRQFLAVEPIVPVKVRAEVVDQFFTDYGRGVVELFGFSVGIKNGDIMKAEHIADNRFSASDPTCNP